MIDKDFTIDTLKRLVQINSVNPSLEEGGAGEAEIGNFIYSLLQSLDIEARVEELAPGRVNVTGFLKGQGNGPSLMLNAHMDTVGVAGMEQPFTAEIKDGRLYGRGAYDMKGSIAAILGAAKAIKAREADLKGGLVLSFVADEEYDSMGARAVAGKYKTDAAIVTEPTGLHPCLAHRGFGVFRIKTGGRTAHGGNHHLGIDANMKMGLLLAELHAFSSELSAREPHPLCGQASLHVPLVEGGRSLFIYSEECRIMVERRTLPGESEESVAAELQQLLDMLRKKEPDFKATLEMVLWGSPYEVASSARIVKEVLQAGAAVKGFQPAFIGHTWWEDSAIFGEAGMETVILGPKGGGIHEEVEWVEVDSVVDLAEVLCRVALKSY